MVTVDAYIWLETFFPSKVIAQNVITFIYFNALVLFGKLCEQGNQGCYCVELLPFWL